MSEHTLGVAADYAILNGSDSQSPHDDEVVGVGVDVLCQHFPVTAFQRTTLHRKIRLGTFLIDIVQVGISDDLEPAGNQRVVDLALPVEFLLVVIFLRKARLHLFKPLVVHLCGIDVAAHDFGAIGFREFYADIDGCIGMVGIIDRDINGLVHRDAS